MKKTLYILSALLLGLVACNKTEFGMMNQPKAGETGKVAVTMQLQVPVPLQAYTKANNMADTPNIDYIKVAVFGTSGYPQAYTLAEPVNKYADANGTTFQFKVLLPVYEGNAHIHIIANGDETIPFDGQNEESIMSVMKTTGDVGAYWARVVSLDGILPQKDQNGIMQTDTEGNFIPSDETEALFDDLVLVRNFAEVRLLSEVAEADLHDISWTLVNVPTTGSVAPMADDTYVDDFASYVYDPQTGKMVNGEKVYNGFMFEEDPMNYTVPEDDAIKLTLDDPGFTFERFHPGDEKATCILMKAKYKSDSFFTYYRLDLTDETAGGYFPLYRNYAYKVMIHKIGNRGSRTIADAMNRDSGGNVSLSTEARKLTDISDGESRLYVEYVEKNFTSGGKKGLWVQYIPDVSTGVVDNSNVEVKIKTQGNALVEGTAITKTDKSTVDGYYFYEFQLNDQSETTDLVSVLQVSATNYTGEVPEGKDKSTLFRDITLRVVKKMDMTLSLVPKKVDGFGSTTVLKIGLPEDLPESMFPLEFKIEDINHSLYSTGTDGNGNTITVPVKSDKSLVDGTTNSFYFIRTVASYEEYQANNPVCTEFKTNKDASATTIYVANEYFKTQTINLLNDGIYVNPTKSTVPFNVTEVEIEVEAADQTATWTVSAGSGVTVSPASGTGNGSFKMTFPANNSTTAAVQRTARVTSGGVNHDVTITQEALAFSITPDTQTVLYNATSATVTVNAGEGQAWTASVDNGASLSAASGTGTATLTVTLPVNETAGSRTYNVSATITALGATTSANIVQRRQPNEYSDFAYNTFGNTVNGSATANSNDGYVTVDLANCYKGWNNNYIRTSNNNQYGTITVTPIDGMKITTVVITYADDFVDQNPSVSTGSRTVSGNTVTWTVNSSSAVTYTSSNNGGQNQGRRVTNIRVSCVPAS